MSEPLKRRRLTSKQPIGCTLFPAPEMPSKPTAKSLAPKKDPKKRAKPVDQAQQAKRAKASATMRAVPADDVTDAESPKASGTTRAVPADDVTYAEIEAMPLLQVHTGSVITIENLDPEMLDVYSSDEIPHSLSSSDDDEPPPVRLPKKMARRSSDRRASHYGLSGGTFRALRRMGAPILLFNALMALFLCPGLMGNQDLRGAEIFSGVASIHQAFDGRGYASAKYDFIIDGELCNILTPSGWNNGLTLVGRLQPNSLIHSTTVCSTWVFMSRGSTNRSMWCPLSPLPWSEGIAQADCTVSRVCLYWFLVVASACTFVSEQPLSSLMALLPRIVGFRAALKAVKQGWHHTHLWMGMYAAPTRKPTRPSATARTW